jgi:hypothetical protein
LRWRKGRRVYGESTHRTAEVIEERHGHVRAASEILFAVLVNWQAALGR